MFYINGAFYLHDPDGDEELKQVHVRSSATQKDNSLENTQVDIPIKVPELNEKSTIRDECGIKSEDHHPTVNNDCVNNRKLTNVKSNNNVENKVQIEDVLKKVAVHISTVPSVTLNKVYSYNEGDKAPIDRDGSGKDRTLIISIKRSEGGDDSSKCDGLTYFGIPSHYWYQVSVILQLCNVYLNVL